MKSKLIQLAICSVFMTTALFLFFMLMDMHEDEFREKIGKDLFLALVTGIGTPAVLILGTKPGKSRNK